MEDEKEIKFIRLTETAGNIDIVGFVSVYDDYIIVEKPLKIEVETLFEEGKQLVYMQEYLPQSILDIREVEFLQSDIMFMSPIRDSFVDQYIEIAEFFYSKMPKMNIQETKVKMKKEMDEDEDKDNKVVSLIDAILEKKNKPIH